MLRRPQSMKFWVHRSLIPRDTSHLTRWERSATHSSCSRSMDVFVPTTRPRPIRRYSTWLRRRSGGQPLTWLAYRTDTCGVTGTCVPANPYMHSNLYVIQKSSALTSTLHVTPFYNVVKGLFAVETIQGVDSVDSMTTGYAVAAKETETPSAHLSIWQI